MSNKTTKKTDIYKLILEEKEKRKNSEGKLVQDPQFWIWQIPDNIKRYEEAIFSEDSSGVKELLEVATDAFIALELVFRAGEEVINDEE